ncbi:MAG: D-glycero-beta-D-manno-heptose-7-phosphate kinase [Rhodospirillales bacterium]
MTQTPDSAVLLSLLDRATDVRVLCVGDVMLDRFISGSVDRISPEAPVPILRVEDEAHMLGGVGNVARNIAAIGATAEVVTVVGDDPAGSDVAGLFKDNPGIDAHLIADSERRTAIKTRYIGGTQQLLRADRESPSVLSDMSAAKIVAAAKKAMKRCAVLVLSDYGKGVLSPAVIGELIDLARKAGIPVIVDPKGRDFWRYQGADVVTPNRRELAEAVGHPTNAESEIVDGAKSLIIDNDLGAVLVTRSQDGMTLVSAEGTVDHLQAEAREVFDVSGAGDTVVAALAAGRAAGASWVDAAALANVAAGIAVAKVGTAVAFADDIVQALHHQDRERSGAKVLGLEQLKDRVSVWRRGGKKVGFTNGCFDLLHPGHVSLLAQARAACDRLIVGLNSDSSVRALKGEGRPVQNEASRSAVLASLGSVDAIVLFSDETPIELIRALKPDVLVKGADYTVETVVGSDIVLGYGGRVVLADLEDGHSTTGTIARMSGEKP